MYSKLKRPLLVSLGAVAAIGLIAGAATAVGGKISKVDAADANTVTDVITSKNFLATGSSYIDSTYLAPSGITYKANSANSNGDIQLRSKSSNSGIVVSENNTGLTIASISIVWGSGNATDRQLDIYVSNEAYTAPSDLYSDEIGDSVGDIDYSTGETQLSIPIDSQLSYVGVRSNNGALYLKSITFVWSSTAVEPEPEFGTLDSITVDASSAKVEYKQGDLFDWTGLSVKAMDTAGIERNVVLTDPGLRIDPADGSLAKETGSFEATVTYEFNGVSKTDTFEYTVEENVLTEFTKVDGESLGRILLGSKIVLAYGSVGSGSLTSSYLAAAPTGYDAATSDQIFVGESTDLVPMTLALGYTEGTYAFYHDASDGNGYVSVGGSGKLNLGFRGNEKWSLSTSFNIAISSEDGSAEISGYLEEKEYQLQYNPGNPRFTFYAGTQKDPYLFAAVPTAEEQVHELATYIMEWDSENQCVTHYGVAKDAFVNHLDGEAQEIFKTTIGDASEEADLVAQAKARYDAWAINRGDYETRFDGNAPSGAAIVKNDANDDMGIYVGALAIVLAGIGVGSAVIIKKRKSRI